MKRLFTLLLLFVLAPAAYASNWVLVKETPSLGWKMFSYIDADSVVQEGSLLTFWYSFNVTKALGTNQRVQKLEVDLSAERYRILETHVFVNDRPESQSLTPSKPRNSKEVKEEIAMALRYVGKGGETGPVPAPPPAGHGGGTASPAAGASMLFTTTIMGAAVQEVQDAIIAVMTREKYTLEEVDDNKVVMGRQGASVLFMPGAYSRVRFNMLPRDGNIRLLVNQVDSQGPQSQQRPISALVPLIREIRNKVDGTPMDQITNETATASAGTEIPKGKTLGIVLGAKNTEGFIVIERVETGSKGAETGLAAQDVMLEVNGRSTKDFEPGSLKAYLEEKWSQKASIIVVYSREGKTDLVTIKE